jgi:hypothetical protein
MENNHKGLTRLQIKPYTYRDVLLKYCKLFGSKYRFLREERIDGEYDNEYDVKHPLIFGERYHDAMIDVIEKAIQSDHRLPLKLRRLLTGKSCNKVAIALQSMLLKIQESEKANASVLIDIESGIGLSTIALAMDIDKDNLRDEPNDIDNRIGRLRISQTLISLYSAEMDYEDIIKKAIDYSKLSGMIPDQIHVHTYPFHIPPLDEKEIKSGKKPRTIFNLLKSALDQKDVRRHLSTSSLSESPSVCVRLNLDWEVDFSPSLFDIQFIEFGKTMEYLYTFSGNQPCILCLSLPGYSEETRRDFALEFLIGIANHQNMSTNTKNSLTGYEPGDVIFLAAGKYVRVLGFVDGPIDHLCFYIATSTILPKLTYTNIYCTSLRLPRLTDKTKDERKYIDRTSGLLNLTGISRYFLQTTTDSPPPDRSFQSQPPNMWMRPDHKKTNPQFKFYGIPDYFLQSFGTIKSDDRRVMKWVRFQDKRMLSYINGTTAVSIAALFVPEEKMRIVEINPHLGSTSVAILNRSKLWSTYEVPSIHSRSNKGDWDANIQHVKTTRIWNVSRLYPETKQKLGLGKNQVDSVTRSKLGNYNIIIYHLDWGNVDKDLYAMKALLFSSVASSSSEEEKKRYKSPKRLESVNFGIEEKLTDEQLESIQKKIDKIEPLDNDLSTLIIFPMPMSKSDGSAFETDLEKVFVLFTEEKKKNRLDVAWRLFGKMYIVMLFIWKPEINTEFLQYRFQRYLKLKLDKHAYVNQFQYVV